MQIHLKGTACGNTVDGFGPNYFKNMGKWNYCFQLHNSIKSHWYSRGLSILSVLLVKSRFVMVKRLKTCLKYFPYHKNNFLGFSLSLLCVG